MDHDFAVQAGIRCALGPARNTCDGSHTRGRLFSPREPLAGWARKTAIYLVSVPAVGLFIGLLDASLGGTEPNAAERSPTP
jgi:hypothetical protein